MIHTTYCRYEKGAEVVRMTHCLLGEATFRQGMDDYFAAFDGQAVTCDDFRLTMAAAAAKHGKTDVATLLRTSFERWYDQVGGRSKHNQPHRNSLLRAPHACMPWAHIHTYIQCTYIHIHALIHIMRQHY